MKQTLLLLNSVLGEGLVGGSITPTSYRVQWTTRTVLPFEPSNQKKKFDLCDSVTSDGHFVRRKFFQLVSIKLTSK
jgi:hypothetical protein